jgi:hypothetical protein
LDTCFDFDWRCSKLEKTLGQSPKDRERIYNLLRDFYPHIKNVYDHYSSISPAGGLVTCMGSNTLGEIVLQCPGLLDRVNLNLSKVDLMFVTNNATKC